MTIVVAQAHLPCHPVAVFDGACSYYCYLVPLTLPMVVLGVSNPAALLGPTAAPPVIWIFWLQGFRVNFATRAFTPRPDLHGSATTKVGSNQRRSAPIGGDPHCLGSVLIGWAQINMGQDVCA
jgi:hypothetical protein